MFGCLIFSRMVLIIMFYFVPEYRFEWLGVAPIHRSVRLIQNMNASIKKEVLISFVDIIVFINEPVKAKKKKRIHPALVCKGWIHRHG
ncbi:hypothetical protein ES705_41465 [subsurface metagenome]